MFFDGEEFIALHDEVAGEGQFVDSFLEGALRSNMKWLDAQGHLVSWCPRVWNASSQTAYKGERPYASAAWSTMLCVPWISQRSRSSITALLSFRTGDESGGAETVQVRLNIGAHATEPATLPHTSATSQPWQAVELTPFQERPDREERIEDLMLWQKGNVDVDLLAEDTAVSEFYAGGAILSNPNTLFEKAAGALPDAQDQHVQVLFARNDVTLYDILDSRAVPNMAFVRPVQRSYRDYVDNIALRSLGYIQLRSVQISETFDVEQDRPDASRFLPHKTVEGRDAASHALEIHQHARRWRPLLIGPTGEAGAPEFYPTGYGRKFEELVGSITKQHFFAHPITPRHSAPSLRLLLDVIGVWDGRSSLRSRSTSLETMLLSCLRAPHSIRTSRTILRPSRPLHLFSRKRPSTRGSTSGLESLPPPGRTRKDSCSRRIYRCARALSSRWMCLTTTQRAMISPSF